MIDFPAYVSNCRWRPGVVGASVAVILSAVFVLWIDSVAPSAVAALRAAQLHPDRWVVDYVAVGQAPHDAQLIVPTPNARFRASRIECIALPGTRGADSPKPGNVFDGSERVVRCTFFRLPLARLILEAQSVEKARPEVLAFILEAPYPFELDTSRLGRSWRLSNSLLSFFDSENGTRVSLNEFIIRFSSYVGYLGSHLLIALLLFRGMRQKNEVTVCQGLRSLKQCRILLMYFLAVLSTPAIAFVQLALQGRIDTLWSVSWLSLNVVDLLVLSPIVEEIVYRAWLIPFLSRAMDVRMAAVLSGFLFFFAHWPPPSFGALIGHVLAAALLTGLWLRSNSLWVCVVAHMAWNLNVLIRGNVAASSLPM